MSERTAEGEGMSADSWGWMSPGMREALVVAEGLERGDVSGQLGLDVTWCEERGVSSG